MGDLESISYPRASKVTQEVVDLVFKHNQDCEFTKVIDDFTAFCDKKPVNCELETIGTNVLTNSPILIGKVTDLVNMLMEDALLNDQELIAFTDRMMELYGSMLSFVFDFKSGSFHT